MITAVMQGLFGAAIARAALLAFHQGRRMVDVESNDGLGWRLVIDTDFVVSIRTARP